MRRMLSPPVYKHHLGFGQDVMPSTASAVEGCPEKAKAQTGPGQRGSGKAGKGLSPA